MKNLKQNLSIVIFTILLFTGIFNQSNQLLAQNSGLVNIQSAKSFDETVETVNKLISKNGMMVLSTINQGKILSMTGLSLKATSLFVGNPQVGKKLFTADKGVGVAIPVRLNIYENTDGNTYVNYVKPSSQLSNFDNKKIQMIGGKLDEKLGMLTKMIAK